MRDFSRFRHYVTIERREASRDDYGATVSAWSEVARAFASVRGVGGREAAAPGLKQVVATATHVITFRWPGFDVRPGEYRIIFKGRVFNVEAVDNLDEADRYVVVKAVENADKR